MIGEAALAARYRKWLRAYPRSWRAQRQEEVLGVLLDVAAAEGRTAPTVRERLDLLGHGLAVRAGLTVAPEPVRRAAASAALVYGALLSVWAWVYGSNYPMSVDAPVPAPAAGPGYALLLAVQVLAVLALVVALAGFAPVARLICLVVAGGVPLAATALLALGAEQGLVFQLLLPALLAGLGTAAGGRVLDPGAMSFVSFAAAFGLMFWGPALFSVLDDQGWATPAQAAQMGVLAALSCGLALIGRRVDVAGGLAVLTALLIGFLLPAQVVLGRGPTGGEAGLTGVGGISLWFVGGLVPALTVSWLGRRRRLAAARKER